ncbi:MAG TPA: hypothetical protein VNU26_01855 [Mycobacteriales bacterium]|nr:hypothetical protein [Mycobacteriales bacterium]
MTRDDVGCTWWDDRWAWRGALAAAPFGALAVVLHALLVLRTSFGEALVLYAVGALAASGVGCLVAGPLGGTACAVRRWRASRRPEPYPDLEPAADREAVAGGRQLTLDDAIQDAVDPRHARSPA